MLWSLILVLVFVAIIVALAYGSEWILANGEGIYVEFAGQTLDLDPLRTLIFAVLVVVAIYIAVRLLGMLLGSIAFFLGRNTALSRFLNRRRERRGNRILSEGMLALASGDSKLAMRKALLAEKKLSQPEIGKLLAAQAAEQMGDKDLAKEAYKDLLTNDKTRFLAIRGLMKHKQGEGDEATALQLAKKALDINPSHDETSTQLFLMQAHEGDWSGARKTLGIKRRYRTAPKDMATRRDGLLALCQAIEFRKAGNLEEARKAAMDALKEVPNFAPAVVEGAKALIESKNKGKAASAIRSAWASEPHPSLAAAYAEIEPDETPAQRVKRFADLVRRDTDHPEARMLMAEVNIAAEDFPAARRALGDLTEKDPTARAMTLMAAIERGEGSDDSTVKAWLAKAVTAPRGPAWVCETEGAVYAEWQPICDVCGGFDTLTWKAAPAGEVMADTSVGAMLPLIIGALEDKSSDAEDGPETVDSTAEEATEKA
ncbi:MAG: heme biosynthesis HemY N-terminal domain-containing protein [Pseudomonadota bacterium]